MLTRTWIQLRGLWTAWRSDQRGQALTEYGLILALVAVAVILLLGALGGRLGELFQSITNSIDTTP